MTEQTWIAIGGHSLKIDGGLLTLVADAPPKAEANEQPTGEKEAEVAAPASFARSNSDFEQGTITWEAWLGDATSRAQILLPMEPAAASNTATPSSDFSKVQFLGTELAAGLNATFFPYGFARWNNGWEGAGGVGRGTPPPVGQWIPMRLTAQGSEVSLFVSGVKAFTVVQTLRRGQIGVLLQTSTKCEIRNVEVFRDLPSCFVVMQFTDDYNVLYKDVIKPVCESYGYRVIRGDDFYTSGQIIEDVTRSIRLSNLIIADVTPDNANVFYEVGYAHAIGKPTILLSNRTRERLPFDIAGLRTLFYDNTIGGKALVESRLKQHLDQLRPK